MRYRRTRFGASMSAGDAAEVDDQRRRGDDPRVVDLLVSGDDAGNVAVVERRLELDRGEAELGDLGHVRVVVGDLGAQVAEEAGDLQRRRLAHVADARLVGDAEQQHP